MSLHPIRRAVASALRQPLACRFGARAMTMDGIESFKQAERAAEALYFNKQEEKLLHNLLVKMKVQTPFNASPPHPPHMRCESNCACSYCAYFALRYVARISQTVRGRPE